MKKLLPIILIGALVLVAGAYFLLQNKGQQLTGQLPQAGEMEEQESVDQEKTITGNLKEILRLGQSLKCTWSREDGGAGTIWVKNDMFYNEFKSGEQQGKMIYKDYCMWTWYEGQTQAVKICFSPEEAEEMFSGEAESSSQTDTNVPTNVNYNCQRATVSDSRFDPPEDIQFMDMEGLMKEMSQ